MQPKSAKRCLNTSKCFTTASGCIAPWATTRRRTLKLPILAAMRIRKELDQRSMRRLESLRPVKQKRALLQSNPPRDNWIEGDEITVSTWGGQNLPKTESGEDYFRAEHALKTSNCQGGCSGAFSAKKSKTSLSECSFFRSNPMGSHLGHTSTWGHMGSHLHITQLRP